MGNSQTILGPFSGQVFSTVVPHTVRARETKTCTDCHVSKANDNNAVMAQLMMQGTNFVNFMGRYVYVAADDAPVGIPPACRAFRGEEDRDAFAAGGQRAPGAFETGIGAQRGHASLSVQAIQARPGIPGHIMTP